MSYSPPAAPLSLRLGWESIEHKSQMGPYSISFGDQRVAAGATILILIEPTKMCAAKGGGATFACVVQPMGRSNRSRERHPSCMADARRQTGGESYVTIMKYHLANESPCCSHHVCRARAGGTGLHG